MPAKEEYLTSTFSSTNPFVTTPVLPVVFCPGASISIVSRSAEPFNSGSASGIGVDPAGAPSVDAAGISRFAAKAAFSRFSAASARSILAASSALHHSLACF